MESVVSLDVPGAPDEPRHCEDDGEFDLTGKVAVITGSSRHRKATFERIAEHGPGLS
jgi:hypothetical protein